MNTPPTGSLHHIELWVPHIGRAREEWGWILGRLGYEPFQNWDLGSSWRLGGTYIVAEESPALSGRLHERTSPGLNHLAFHAGPREQVDTLIREGAGHGWQQLFADRYPYAGGPDHYAGYLVNSDGFEVELVAVG